MKNNNKIIIGFFFFAYEPDFKHRIELLFEDNEGNIKLSEFTDFCTYLKAVTTYLDQNIGEELQKFVGKTSEDLQIKINEIEKIVLEHLHSENFNLRENYLTEVEGKDISIVEISKKSPLLITLDQVDIPLLAAIILAGGKIVATEIGVKVKLISLSVGLIKLKVIFKDNNKNVKVKSTKKKKKSTKKKK